LRNKGLQTKSDEKRRNAGRFSRYNGRAPRHGRKAAGRLKNDVSGMDDS
jgi:hypothetical protein